MAIINAIVFANLNMQIKSDFHFVIIFPISYHQRHNNEKIVGVTKCVF